MNMLILILAIFVGVSIAACITASTLAKSNELGNSKSSLRELGGTVIIMDRKDNVGKDYPLYMIPKKGPGFFKFGKKE